MRRFFLVLLMVFLVAPAAHAATGWVQPVPGALVRPFDPPKTRYGPGHLGADLRALPGTFVRAAGDGEVVFAGAIGDTRHVVVRHAGGLRTSYSFLATVRVHTGEHVGPGEILGTAGGTGPNHDGTVLHLGLRVGDHYVDPMQLFDDPDLTALVHLAPLDDRPATPERIGLEAGLPPPDDNPVMCRTWSGGLCAS